MYNAQNMVRVHAKIAPLRFKWSVFTAQGHRAPWEAPPRLHDGKATPSGANHRLQYRDIRTMVPYRRTARRLAMLLFRAKPFTLDHRLTLRRQTTTARRSTTRITTPIVKQ